MQNQIVKALASLVLAAVVAVPAHAQGKGKDKEKNREKGKDKDKVTVVTTTSGGEVVALKRPVVVRQKRVTMPQAVSVTREVLVANGYQVTQVVPSGTTQVIYFRRGNRGNGRGLGPVE